MVDREREGVLRKRVKWLIIVFVVCLVVSGLTAFPLEWELNVLAGWMDIPAAASAEDYTGMKHWIAKVRNGLNDTYAHYPFIAYGTDWLAFAHIILGILFLGVLRDPVKNIWVVEFGLISCVLVVPLALICGPIRGVPFYWQLIDCSFGVVGFVPLYVCRNYIKELHLHSVHRRG